MDRKNVPESKVFNWYEEDGSIVIDYVENKMLINQTGKIVWELINGVNSIQDIINTVFEKYGEENSQEYVAEIVEESIKLFMDENLIILKTGDELDEWMQFE